MKKLKILLLLDHPYVTPRGYDFKEEFKKEDYFVYDEVSRALRKNGHQVNLLGIHNDLTVLIEEIKEDRPDIVFNLADIFDEKSYFDKHIVCVLEMLGVRYTGASPNGLFICNNKSLTKKLLSYHRIRVPRFDTFYRNRKIGSLKKMRFPLIVKPLCEEASRGIAQASIVDKEDTFVERVKFIHEHMQLDAIVEEYIDGREFYVSILGNKRVHVLPIREMKFGNFPDDEPRIATYKAKWDFEYREKWGIKNVFAGRLPEGWQEKITDTCKRVYLALNMRCYARVDVRVTEKGKVYVIEANANPNLQRFDEFALSADKTGINFETLLERIIDLSLQVN